MNWFGCFISWMNWTCENITKQALKKHKVTSGPWPSLLTVQSESIVLFLNCCKVNKCLQIHSECDSVGLTYYFVSHRWCHFTWVPFIQRRFGSHSVKVQMWMVVYLLMCTMSDSRLWFCAVRNFQGQTWSTLDVWRRFTSHSNRLHQFMQRDLVRACGCWPESSSVCIEI